MSSSTTEVDGESGDGREIELVNVRVHPTDDNTTTDDDVNKADNAEDKSEEMLTVSPPEPLTDSKLYPQLEKTKESDVDNTDYAVEEFEEEDDNKVDACGRCFVVDFVVGSRSCLWKFYCNHKFEVKVAILVFLVVLYFVYFSFALHYSFGDEASIRLLWITCLVVVCLALTLLLSCLRPKFQSMSTSRPISYTRHHHLRINWAVLVVLYTFLIIFVIVDVVVETKNYYNLVSLAGIVFYLVAMFYFSTAPRKVKWQTVLWGIGLQFIFALIVLRWQAGYTAFKWLGDRVSEFLAYSDAGAEFVFGASYRDHFIAFQVLPVIVFLSSIVSVLFYWGVMQWLIRKMAWVMQFTMATTAAESLNAAANIFLGMADAPLAIRPMLPYLTKSEIHAVMTGGFATIAGSVLAAYILFGVPANHLLSASFMSAPAALAVAKLFYPETKKSHTTAKHTRQLMPKGMYVNFIEAAAAGAANSISLVAHIAVNLIAFIAILHFVNATLMWFGQRVGWETLTYEFICSYVLFPLALFMGVHLADCRKVAGLIGTKTFLSEFIAYLQLSQLIGNRKALEGHMANNGTWHWSGDDVVLTSVGLEDTLLTNGVISERSELISTYVLCGFGSLGAMGIQIGALVSMAPTRRKDIALVVLRSLIAGNVACHMTACIAGLFFQDV